MIGLVKRLRLKGQSKEEFTRGHGGIGNRLTYGVLWGIIYIIMAEDDILAKDLRIESILSLQRILFLNFPDKRDVLIKMAENLSEAPQIKNSQELTTEILKREELMSTAIGRGIAIPHIRLPSVTDLVVSVGISRTDILDFHPLDDEPVRLLFMIAAAHNQHKYYLQVLSWFSAKLKNKDLRDALIASQSQKEVYDLLIG
jgi:PTS system nitrogen regulatory IIA component